MGPEKPPRRSRTKQEPAVIDLDAADVSSEVDPVSGDPVTEETPTGLTEAEAAEATATAEEVAIADGDGVETNELPSSAEASAEEVVLADDNGIDTSELPSPAEVPPAEDEKPEEIRTAEALAAEPAPAEPMSDSETEKPAAAIPPASPERTSGASVTGAVAAGIFGGLVALAGAGGMQYAGYLPSFNASAPAPTVPAADTSALEVEITALKGQIATLAERPAAPAVDTSALEARLAALEAAPGVADVPTVNLAPLEEQLAALSGEVSQLEGALAGADEKQQSIQTTLLDRLQKMEAEVNDPTRRNAVARAIAASSLKAAIDRGGGFLQEFETFAGVAGDDSTVTGLRRYAETGVPARAALIAGFPNAANAVLAALHRADPNQGIVDRLWSSALSLVTVRPVGQIEGETPEAFIARSEEALKNGDLEASLAEWNRLPEEGRAAAADFSEALAARIQVERLVGAALRDAVNGAAGY